MSRSRVETFDSTVQTTNEWLHDFGQAVGMDHAELAYRGLRATLHAIRDRLPPSDVAHLAGQLPMLVRGFFYEGWKPLSYENTERSAEDFLAYISNQLNDGGPSAAPRDIARATFEVLNKRISEGEVEKVRHLLPEPVRNLWPKATH